MHSSSQALSSAARRSAPGAVSLPGADLDIVVDQAAVGAGNRIQPRAFASLGLGEAARTMARVAGTTLTMPRSACARLLAERRIEDQDLALAIAELAGEMPLRTTPASVRAEALKPPPARATFRLPSFAALAEEATGVRWEAFLLNNISNWASAYFDRDEARWPQYAACRDPWLSYRHQVSMDRSAELLGLPGARAVFAVLPCDTLALLRQVPLVLGVAPELLPNYYHRLLCDVADWVSYADDRGWDRQKRGENGAAARQLLTIRAAWELTLFKGLANSRLEREWQNRLDRYTQDDKTHWYGTHGVDQVLQLAFERSQQRGLAGRLLEATAKVAEASESRPKLQAAFCIDSESERLRRALQSVNPHADTLTFSAMPDLPVGFDDPVRGSTDCASVTQRRIPHAIGGKSKAGPDFTAGASVGDMVAGHWKRFKRAAVATVECMPGLTFLPPPARPASKDASSHSRGPGKLQPALELTAKVDLAETLLRSMSLTRSFAALVLLAGHRSDPGGHAGVVTSGPGKRNFELAAELLNDRYVRAMLSKRGIAIADDTLFVAGLYDLTTHEMSLIEPEDIDDTHREPLAALRRQLTEAGVLLRQQRTARLATAGADTDAGLGERANVGPAEGLAHGSTFIAAPREKTRGLPLEGHTVLHNYCADSDPQFKVLEQILAGPLVDAGRFALPHAGRRDVSAPLRPTAVVEAPQQAVNDIIDRHPLLRELVDNSWIQIHVLDQRGQLRRRLTGGSDWVEVTGTITNTSQTRAA